MKNRSIALKAALVLAVFGGLWILLTDVAAGYLAPNQSQLAVFQFIKGLAFILLASALLYRFLASQLWRQERDLAQEERRSREIQAIADLATLALSAKTLDSIFEQAVEQAQLIPSFDVACLLEVNSGGATRSLEVRAAVGSAAEDLPALSLRDQPGPPERSFRIEGDEEGAAAYLAMDEDSQNRFNSGIVAEIRTSGGSFGCLAVFDRDERPPSALERAFIRGLAYVLGLAIERQEWSDRLAATADQQRALAELGSLALGADDLDRLFQEAAAAAARQLHIDYTAIFELNADRSALRLTAGAGWEAGWVGELSLPAEESSLAGYTLSVGRPVIAEDLEADARFEGSRLLEAHGVVSGLGVVIEGEDQPLGVLCAHGRSRQDFDEDDVFFLQSLANILSEASQREASEAESRFQSQLLESVVEAVIATDLEGEIRYWNRGAELTYGWSAEEAVGRPIHELTVAEESLEEAEEILAEVMQGGSWSGEFLVRNKDGEEFSAFVTDTPIYDRNDRIIGVIGVSRDLREMRRIERELEESEAFHRLVLSNISDAVFLTDEAGEFKFVCVNTHFAFGYSEHEVHAMGNIKALFDGELLVGGEALDRADLISNIEVQAEHKSGAQRDLLVNVKRVSIRGGTRLYTCRDITDRKAAERALAESESRYRSLTEDVLDSSTVGTFIVGPDLRVIWINRAVERYFNIERSNVVGRDIRQVVEDSLMRQAEDPENFHARVMETYSDNGSSTEFDCHIRDGDGRGGRWLHHSSQSIEQGPYAGGWIEHYTDFTARKRAEQRLMLQGRRLEALRRLDEILLSAQSTQDMAQAALATLDELIDFDCALVISIERAKGTARCEAVRGECGPELQVGDTLHLADSGLNVEAFERERIVERIDVAREAPAGWARDQALLAGMRSIVAARMVAHGESIGFVGLGRRAGNPFDQPQKDTMQEVGDALAMGIRGIRLLRREQSRTAELDAVRRASVQISSQLELYPVLDTICEQSMRLLPAEDCNIFLYDGEELAFGAARDREGPLDQPFAEPRPDGLTYRVARSGERIVVEDSGVHPLYENAFAGWQGSIVGLPLRIRGEVVGVMNMGFDEPRAFTSEELLTMERLGEMAAIAISNARLYQAEKRQRAEASALLRAALNLSQQTDLDAVLQSIVTTLRETIEAAEAVTIFFHDREKDCLVARAWVGHRDEEMQGLELSTDTGLAGEVFGSLTPCIYHDAQSHPAFEVLGEDQLDTIKSLAGVPLLLGEESLGVLFVDNFSSTYAFSEADLALLEAMAAQASTAIGRARLFDRLRASRAQLVELSRELVRTQESEKRHLARELHDEVGQILTGLKLNLEMLESDGEASPTLRRAIESAEDLLRRVRDLSLELRPSMLDDLGLIPAVEWLADRMHKQSGVKIVVAHDGGDQRFPPEVETAAYRIVQEALTNVVRHADASRCDVRVRVSEGILQLEIEDDGRGFEPDNVIGRPGHTGISGMRERASLVHGRLAIRSTPGKGTRIAAELPLDPVEWDHQS